MAKYKPVDAAKLDSDLAAVADAIRTKTGSTETMAFPDGFVSSINAIRVAGAGGDYEDANEKYY